MYFKIRQHVEDLFKSVETNESVIELKEEIITNSAEKYDDLVASGMEEEAAYAKVISGIGNVIELLGYDTENQDEIDAGRKNSAIFISIGVGLYILGLIPSIVFSDFVSYNIENVIIALMFLVWAVATFMVVFGALTVSKDKKVKTKEQKRRALYYSAAIGMYVSSLIPVLLFESFQLDSLGVALMFLIIGIATIMLVYQHVSKPKRSYEPETVVEEFKQWQVEKEKNPICKAIQSTVWLIGVAIYLVISFVFSAWSFSWIIFIITAIITRIIKLCFDLTE